MPGISALTGVLISKPNEQRLSDAEPKLIAGTVVHVVG
jgi:hypothetical protein